MSEVNHVTDTVRIYHIVRSLRVQLTALEKQLDSMVAAMSPMQKTAWEALKAVHDQPDETPPVTG